MSESVEDIGSDREAALAKLPQPTASKTVTKLI